MADYGHFMDHLPPFPQENEAFSILSHIGQCKVERIVSDGQSSAEGFWYDQNEDEWVMVLEGETDLEWEYPHRIRTLHPMDWVFLPAHERHRVARTLPRTIWLAIWGGKEN